MKILFIGDYSNLHACLAEELRKKGHSVDVLSDRGGYMNTHADYYLARQPGILGGFKYLYRLFSLLPQLSGYDVVQLINPNFLNLRPGKIKYFFDHIRRQNGPVFLTLAGNDYYYVKACADAKIFDFSEFKVGNQLTKFVETDPEKMYGWISDVNRRWNEYLYENIQGAMAVLPEYDMAARPILGDKVAFTNLPINLSRLPYSPNKVEDKTRIFIGIRGGMEIQKGAGMLLNIAKELEAEMPDKLTVEKVSNVSLDEYISRMKKANIVLDQLYAYSPATNALQAMALGKVAGSGAQPIYYDYIDPISSQPIFTLAPTDTELKDRLRDIVQNHEEIMIRGEWGRKLVEKNNDVKVVVDKFIKHWEKLS
ncbi:MAG: hypothetical protein HDR88_03485 [Bacteroides sp.]|nr:hypothetical protein [Bacteroides sp.]